MKFTVKRRDLGPALKIVSSTLGTGNGDIASHFVFRSTPEGEVEVLSNKSTVYSSVILTGVSLEGEGRFTIEGSRLLQWLRAVGELEVITFEFLADKSVQCSESRGKQKFSSLDPSLFPYWDETLKKASESGVLPASRLRDALGHVKRFVSDLENKYPNLTVAEVQEGILKSSDRAAMAAVKVAGAENIQCRFTGKNIGNVMKFLDQFGDLEVEVLSTERTYFIKAPGAVLGETKYTAPFPELTAPWDKDFPHTCVVSVEDLSKGMQWLQAGADSNDEKIYLQLDSEHKKLRMKMHAVVSGELVTHEIDCIEIKVDESAQALPAQGVAIPCSYLTSALAGHSEDSVRVDLIPEPNRDVGFLRILDQRNEDQYLTLVGWLIR